ncbi:GIY-YIG nuclease family protein [Halegenticoccus tardaugens]|uniref:GIY-YIG nuclease family protein n=1 Tax=Halegenticoccus tardaugens TaxID=2071624 RepID=UPI00100C2D93|nr:GIY-YIG nuclease family protein [Halegenticoccus tardaugens]
MGKKKGTYTLIFELPAPHAIHVGALGDSEFPAGGYAYTGSAFGPGGLARVDRHRRVAAGERDARHWHVDFLAGHPDSSLRTAVETPGEDIECAVARRLGSGPVDGFGASDCACPSHLAYRESIRSLVDDVETAHEAEVRR